MRVGVWGKGMVRCVQEGHIGQGAIQEFSKGGHAIAKSSAVPAKRKSLTLKKSKFGQKKLFLNPRL